jgi:membrane fusion protein (multidrug efflux system)
LVGSSQNGQWVISGGLKAGDRVIVDGFQKMFVPGAPVTPVPWQPAGAASAGKAPAALASAATAASGAAASAPARP